MSKESDTTTLGKGEQKPRLLIITNLYFTRWHKTRGTFNQQQFLELANDFKVSVAVPITMRDFIEHPGLVLRSVIGREFHGEMAVYYALYLSLPGPLSCLNSLSLLVALVVQHPILMLFRTWECIYSSWLFPDAVASCALAYLRKIPMIATALGTDVNEYSMVFCRMRQIRWLSKHSSRIVTVSLALKRVLLLNGIKDHKVSVIYNGVNSDRFKPSAKTASRILLGVPQEAKLVLFVGNLIPQKGIIELAKSLIELAEKDRSYFLAVVGVGGCKDDLIGLFNRFGLSNNLRYVGAVDNHRLSDIYTAADILCLPSYREGVPNVILEAMSCGIPVVASRVGGIPEVLPDFAGILFDRGQPCALMNAIIQAFETPWDAYRIRCYAQKFSWNDTRREYSDIIRRAIAAKVRDA